MGADPGGRQEPCDSGGGGLASVSAMVSLPEIPHVVPTIGDEVPRRAWIRFALLIALFVIAIGVAVFTDLRHRISPDEVRRALSEAGLWAPAALVVVMTLRPLLLFPLSPLWIASGAFFGWFEGGIWSALGTLSGGLVGLSLARHLGREFVERRLHARVGRWARMDGERAFRTLFLLKLNPLVPDDLINNLAGVSRISYAAFALATLMGTGPIVFVYTYIGSTVWETDSPPFWIAVGILATISVSMLFWNRIAGVWRSMTRARGGSS